MDSNLIKIDYDNINVEEIMQQIRENIQKRGYLEQDMEFLKGDFEPIIKDDEFNITSLKENVFLNNTRWNIIKRSNITSHRKFLGPIIVFFKKLVRKISYWYVEFLVNQQIEFNSSVTKSINEIDRYIKTSEARDAEFEKISAKITELSCMVENHDNRINSLQRSYIPQDLLDATIAQAQNSIQKEVNKYEHMTEVVSNRLRRIEHHIKTDKFLDVKLDSTIENSDSIDMDYFLFESLYRGSRKEIKEKQKEYLEYFKNKKNVLDIGCGRGEFVELLIENGIEVKGVDLDIDNVNFCVDRGLPVKMSEGLTYLQQCEDHSLGGIFLGQVVEHLTIQQLILLIRLAYKKLQPGAYFIAETINPQCLMVYIESFYMDPSHTKPVHPLTLKFLMDTEGFEETKFKYSSPVSDEFRIPVLKCNEMCEDVDKFNQAMAKFNDLMYGYRDYAIVAKR